MDVNADDGDGLDEGCFVFSLICRMVAMFLMRTVDRAAAQSTKAKVAPFHNFILERGGALKLCEDKRHKNAQLLHVFLSKSSAQLATLKR